MQLIEFVQSSLRKLATDPNYNRSSKRTDDLHDVLKREIIEKNPQWKDLKWKFEYKLPVDAFGGTFDIDIAGFDVDGNLKVCILAKGCQSSINKNIKNYANTTIGESARLYKIPNNKIEKILFVSVLPRVAPRFKKDGTVGGFDDVISAKNRTKIDGVLEELFDNTAKVIDLYFDIVDLRNKKTKDEFADIIVENLDSLDALNVT